jgi:cell wall-associated NlpC family hydrolase
MTMTMMIPIQSDIRIQIFDFCKEIYPHEACGIVVGDKVVSSMNIAQEPDQSFILDPQTWIQYPKPDLIWHSHGDDSKWSMADIRTCKRLQIPYFLFSLPTGKEYYYDPNTIEPLIGREWGNWIADCYTLVRDWYQLNLDIELKDFERRLFDDNGNYIWKSPDWDMYRQFLPTIGFVQLDRTEPMVRGDLILLNYGTANPNHAAIYDEPEQNWMLHHYFGNLSGHSVYGAEERNMTDSIWRYTGL